MTRRINAQLRTTQKGMQRVDFLTQTSQIRWQEKQQGRGGVLPVGVGVRVLRHLCVRQEGVVIILIVLCAAFVRIAQSVAVWQGQEGLRGRTSWEQMKRQTRDRLWITALIPQFSYFGHKIIPHAQLWGNELLPVCGPFCGNWRRGGRRLLYRAPRNQHPHVEPTSVSIHILRWGLRGNHWGKEGSQEMASIKHQTGHSRLQHCGRLTGVSWHSASL